MGSVELVLSVFKKKHLQPPTVLDTMQLDNCTLWYWVLPIGSNQDRPVEPRLVTIHDEQQMPSADQKFSNLPSKTDKMANLRKP